ncbi:MAG: S-layer homology domain-containing protein, partial [Ruminococcaceae bacterium]|nr:S-layer homology domain-containing protein [Oscillospiraceae bacterium]
MKKISVCTVCLLLAIFMMLPIAATGTRDVSAETAMAVDLRELGLFNGVSETNFDLERTPTRVEVIVMLIRILGKEAEAQNSEWTHPFTDVPEWAYKYVGYAYENGLTQGVSATKFGVGNASAATYLTFMLRALGYSDQNNLDFSWSDPYDFAKEVGILPELVNTKEFWRADIVTISYAALGVNLKDS